MPMRHSGHLSTVGTQVSACCFRAKISSILAGENSKHFWIFKGFGCKYDAHMCFRSHKRNPPVLFVFGQGHGCFFLGPGRPGIRSPHVILFVAGKVVTTGLVEEMIEMTINRGTTQCHGLW